MRVRKSVKRPAFKSANHLFGEFKRTVPLATVFIGQYENVVQNWKKKVTFWEDLWFRSD